MGIRNDCNFPAVFPTNTIDLLGFAYGVGSAPWVHRGRPGTDAPVAALGQVPVVCRRRISTPVVGAAACPNRTTTLGAGCLPVIALAELCPSS